MQYLVLTEDTGKVNWEEQKELLKEEAHTAWSFLQSGELRNIWFTTDRDAVLLFETMDEESVRNRMDALPLVREGLIRYTILALQPYTGLERLFG